MAPFGPATRPLVLTWLLAALAATGCATHTGRGALAGSALGAGAGAIIGHAAGDSGLGAIIGAGSGLLLGGMAGNALDAYDAGYRDGAARRAEPYDSEPEPAPPPPPPPRCRHPHHHHHHGPCCGGFWGYYEYWD
jgi:hypothetical protein